MSSNSEAHRAGAAGPCCPLRLRWPWSSCLLVKRESSGSYFIGLLRRKRQVNNTNRPGLTDIPMLALVAITVDVTQGQLGSKWWSHTWHYSLMTAPEPTALFRHCIFSV